MRTTTTIIRFLFTLFLALCLGSLVGVQHASAQVSFTGNTTDGLSFNRPDCTGAIPTACTAGTVSARFKRDVIVIGSAGNYDILSTQTFDGMLYLNQINSPFDPNNPANNVLAFNDDAPNVGVSRITTGLNNSGANIAAFYHLVTTGFDTNEFGAYTNTITGPTGGLVLVSDGTNLSNNLTANTSAGPVWNRPNCPTANADPTSLASCAVSSGLSPRFAVHNFTPSCGGPFFFFSEQDFDGFLMLYEESFDISNPLQNLVAYNDDWPAQGQNRRSAFLVNLKPNTKYFFVNTGFDNNSAGTFEQAILGPQNCAVVTAVEDTEEVPQQYDLSEVYPNPFNPQAQFTLTLGQAQHVAIQVFDVLGRQVATLHNGPLAPNTAHQFTFEAAALPSGLYTIRTLGETFNETRQAFLAK